MRFLAMLTPGRQGLEMFRRFDRERPAASAEIAAIARDHGVRFA